MPRIATYTAPTEALSESTRGDAAWEQAGRRLGPLYNETAQFQREQGAAEAQSIKQLLWPMSMVRLREAQAAYNGTGGVSARVHGGTGNNRSHIGLPDNSGDHAAHGQISRGAGVLGNALRDGGYALASRDPETMTSEGGQLITSSESKKLFAKYNKDLDAESSQYLKDFTEAYNKNYTGNPYATDRTNPNAWSYEGGNDNADVTASAGNGVVDKPGKGSGYSETDTGTSYSSGGAFSALSDWITAGTPNETSY